MSGGLYNSFVKSIKKNSHIISYINKKMENNACELNITITVSQLIEEDLPKIFDSKYVARIYNKIGTDTISKIHGSILKDVLHEFEDKLHKDIFSDMISEIVEESIKKTIYNMSYDKMPDVELLMPKKITDGELKNYNKLYGGKVKHFNIACSDFYPCEDSVKCVCYSKHKKCVKDTFKFCDCNGSHNEYAFVHIIYVNGHSSNLCRICFEQYSRYDHD